METDTLTSSADNLYPVLLIPKTCTSLETNCESPDNVFIELTITSPDTEGNEACIYSGFCNIKLIDNSDTAQDQSLNATSIGNNRDQTVTDITYPPYNQSQVWIDPARSPYVYNSCDTAESQEHYSVYHQYNSYDAAESQEHYSVYHQYNSCDNTESQERYSVYHQSLSSHITVEQHNTYITQNVYNCNDSICYSPVEEFEHKKFRKVQNDTSNQNNLADQILYEDDEFECGVFLSKLPEEIWNETENRAREEMKYVGLQSDNDALKQLMSSDIQSLSKQQKTILFLGHDSHFGQTIQKIAINDPNLECAGHAQNVEQEDSIGQSKNPKPNQKKYQCDKCKQIFDQIAEFKQHMVSNHRNLKIPTMAGASDVKFMCLECGKNLKNQEKFEMHCLGHGDPELECNQCHKVFASKFTLRTHRKIHDRKHPCKYCSKTYSNFEELWSHAAKIHFVFMCHVCAFAADTINVLKDHRTVHEDVVRESSDTDFNVSVGEDLMEENGTLSPVRERPEPEKDHLDVEVEEAADELEKIARANSIIAKVASNKMFLLHSKKTKRGKKFRNACDVCLKTFDRVGDLKRHLIEHVIRSTLAKNPVSNHGALNILCEICQSETFTKVDKYKAHLREHAQLTIYKCTFCDKSFSDSSNFSKHKKIHGSTYFQCDLCQRKFNSKKMITQHMEYHNRNAPITCYYCDKVFHFESMLNKHIKCTHTREGFSRFRCRFCHKYFQSLKEKWDHEWTVHNVRKMIVDCKICGAKFRKYSELKRHCSSAHEMDIPPAKNLYRKRKTA